MRHNQTDNKRKSTDFDEEVQNQSESQGSATGNIDWIRLIPMYCLFKKLMLYGYAEKLRSITKLGLHFYWAMKIRFDVNLENNMSDDKSSNNESPQNFCLPKDSGIDQNKAEQMKLAIMKIFEEHKVSFNPKVLMAISYSTDISD